MSSNDSPQSPGRFIKTFTLNVESDPGLLRWLDDQAAHQGYTTVIVKALYDAMRADLARRILPPEPPSTEAAPVAVEINRRLSALRFCLRTTGFWPDATDNARTDEEIREEIVNQIALLPTIPLLVLMFVSSIFTLARLKGVPYE